MVTVLPYPRLSGFYLETLVDLHANFHHLVAADLADLFVLWQMLFHNFHGSSFGNHIVNAAETAFADGLLVLACRSKTGFIPTFCLIEENSKSSNQLVQLLRGAAKELSLV